MFYEPYLFTYVDGTNYSFIIRIKKIYQLANGRYSMQTSFLLTHRHRY